ncbi:unnamed protein product [Clonostachys solani]|uniref:Hypercellular protein HypA n=1 Tax=Clonostachys solani TaxID=160281 RepID=A0A9P0ES24_9HYPO|nr:unnamed protein product [Clonostachys solani]
MSLDPLLPIAPARVKALLLPISQITSTRFDSFVTRLEGEHVVHLRDISADGRPHRNMFSPLAYPDGAMIYDLITYIPPPSHLALTPFDLYREPMAVVALADGREMGEVSFSRRNSANGTGTTVTEKNIRSLYQDLEDLRDRFPKALAHQVLIFDYVPDASNTVPLPEGVFGIPPVEKSKRTTIKTVMCDISSQLLAEMTTLAKSFEAMTTIESPVHYSGTAHMNGDWSAGEGEHHEFDRRNSGTPTLQSNGRTASESAADRAHARMSMPPVSTRPTMNHSSSSPGIGGSPISQTGHSGWPGTPDLGRDAPGTPQTHSRSESTHSSRDQSRDRVSVQGFGPGGLNDRWRLKGKGRSTVILGSMYLQAGRWNDSLRELSEAAVGTRSINDHIWLGKALELIVINLFLLGWSGLEFAIPSVCMPPPEERNRPLYTVIETLTDLPDQPKRLRILQLILGDLLDRIMNLYSRKRADVERLPKLAYSETTIRFSKILTIMHLCNGSLNQQALDMIVTGRLPEKELTTSPRIHIVPSRRHIVNILMDAFPASHAYATELLTTTDRASILSAIATILGTLGLHRKKAMVIRELVSVLITGLVEARTRGAAEAGIHPAAGLISHTAAGNQNNGTALDLGEGDMEKGIEAFLDMLCKSYAVIGFERSPSKSEDSTETGPDTDEAIIARIQKQASTRFYGFEGIKMNILRACINFSEALPDLNGVLRYSGDLLRTAGAGTAPGPRREDISPMIFAEEQARLVTNIARTSSLAQRLNLNSLAAEYWDEFLVRGIQLEPLPPDRIPIPHAHSVLPGSTVGRTSQDVDPFIYNPFFKKPSEVVQQFLVAGELATFRITLQNPYDIELDLESIRLETTGVDFESIPEAARLGSNRTQVLRLRGRPLQDGDIKVTGALIKVRGCRERRFPIFSQPWRPVRDSKIKVKGIAALEGGEDICLRNSAPPVPDDLDLTAIPSQPVLTVKSMTLPQASVMVLEGERRIFSVTLQNESPTPVDFVLFSFQDSTQGPLQNALNNRDTMPTEMYEYEWILMKKQALRLPKKNQERQIPAGGEATYEFEILGKPGLTHATIQVDYTNLGKPQDEVTEQFFTRQVSVDLTVTVNASIEMSRLDVLPIEGDIPQAIKDRHSDSDSLDLKDYCLLSMDLRNAWPSHINVHIETEDGMVLDDNILPGNINRIVLPVKRVYLEDPHASIPSLNPGRDRQFVVSRIAPEIERINREAFWYREKLMERLKGTWKTTSGQKRHGTLELRTLRLTPRMIDVVRLEDIGIDISVEDEDGDNGDTNVGYVDEFMQARVKLTNRSSKPITSVIRLLPALCHRPLGIALDFTRKFAWNGSLQQLLPRIEANSTVDFVIGVTALCRGEFELSATAEEVVVLQEEGEKALQRKKSDTQKMLDAALGAKERRVWHSRHPYILLVRDRD